MKLWPIFALLSISLLPSAALAKKAAEEYPLTYAGGSLPLRQSKVRAALGKDEVVFTQHGRRITVPVKNITEISCGTQVHRRFPLVHLGEIEDHYIGVGWTNANGGAAHVQILLKMSRSEYREFLAAVEKLTGIKAVNTNQVPTVVHYNI